ncbi:MAG: metal-sulfur cluster assembly factor [Desulfurococcaceae archaeon]
MSAEELKKKVIEVLEDVIDPEIGIDVYNLGLVYGIEVEGDKVKIKVTLTTPFCPLANVVPMMIEENIRRRLNLQPIIELVFEPPWNPSMMTEKGRKMFIEKFGYDIVEEYLRQQSEQRFEYP